LIATITVYESDFHILKIIPNRFTRDRTYGSGYSYSSVAMAPSGAGSG
jgi:hypothetical protein